MTRPKPPDGDDLRDLRDVLPPVTEDEPTAEQRARRLRIPATLAGVQVAAAGGSWDDVLAADKAENARLDAEDEALRALQEAEAERRRLDNMERRLRVGRLAEREKRRREGKTT